jgi:hypothetical protein
MPLVHLTPLIHPNNLRHRKLLNLTAKSNAVKTA